MDAPLPNQNPVSSPNTHKRTILLVIVVVIIAVVVIPFVIIQSKKGTPSQSTQTGTQPSPVPNVAYSQLSVVPKTISLPAAQGAQPGSAEIQINTQQNNVTAVQIEMQYDPKVLSNVTVEPGTFFTNPLVLKNTIDPVKGTISYWIAIQISGNAQKGTGSVATISFTATPNQQKASYLTFTNDTLIAGEESATQSLLQKTQGATIVFQ